MKRLALVLVLAVAALLPAAAPGAGCRPLDCAPSGTPLGHGLLAARPNGAHGRRHRRRPAHRRRQVDAARRGPHRDHARRSRTTTTSHGTTRSPGSRLRTRRSRRARSALARRRLAGRAAGRARVDVQPPQSTFIDRLDERRRRRSRSPRHVGLRCACRQQPVSPEATCATATRCGATTSLRTHWPHAR